MKRSGAFKDGDFSRLNSLMEIQNQLIQDQSGISEKVNTNINAGILAAFKGVGGSFDPTKDPRSEQRIMSLMSSLRSPQNEFQQARDFAVLSGLNPKGSYLDILKMQQQSLRTPGFLRGVLDMIAQQTGGGELGVIATMQRFGLSPEVAEQLFNNRINYSDEDMNKIISSKEYKSIKSDISRRAGDIIL